MAAPQIKLPDAIIGATAKSWRIPLVTRKPKDFKNLKIQVHVPYDWNSTTGVVSNIRKPFGKRVVATKSTSVIRIK